MITVKMDLMRVRNRYGMDSIKDDEEFVREEEGRNGAERGWGRREEEAATVGLSWRIHGVAAAYLRSN